MDRMERSHIPGDTGLRIGLCFATALTLVGTVIALSLLHGAAWTALALALAVAFGCRGLAAQHAALEGRIEALLVERDCWRAQAAFKEADNAGRACPYTTSNAQLATYDQAAREGRAACLAGKPRQECPYPRKGSIEREGWLDGYDD